MNLKLEIMKKMKIRTLILSAILATAVLFTSCQKDSVEEPQVGLKFKTVTTPLSLAGTKSVQEAKELSFTSGFITLSEIQFEVETDDDSVEIDFNLEIDTKIDFATGETDPDISYAEIPVGTYNEIELEIESTG